MMELKAYWDSLSGFGKFKFVLKIILVILAMLFAIFNWQSVEVDLVFLKINLPVTVLILMCIVIGFILSSVFDYRRFKKKDKEIADLKKQIENYE
jgi:putative membrane protein